jgi:DNA-binding transcriptional regulator YiaG
MSKKQSKKLTDAQRCALKKLPLTNEQIAAYMRVEARTIQNWKAGIGCPAAKSIDDLNKLLRSME